jgi:hypothetical protein
MSAQEWEGIFKRAWHLYYTPQHIETLLKRAVASGIRTSRIASMIFYFYASPAFEGVHPLQSGTFRRKCRTQRRPGFPRENLLVFYLHRLREIVHTYVPGLCFFYKLERLRRRIERDPVSRIYSDIAMRLHRSPRIAAKRLNCTPSAKRRAAKQGRREIAPGTASFRHPRTEPTSVSRRTF